MDGRGRTAILFNIEIPRLAKPFLSGTDCPDPVECTMSHPAVIYLDKLNGWWNGKPEKSLTGSKLVGEVSAESVRGYVVDVCHVDLQRRHVVDPAT